MFRHGRRQDDAGRNHTPRARSQRRARLCAGRIHGVHAIRLGLIVLTAAGAVLGCGPRADPAGESRPSPPATVTDLAAALADPERIFAGILRTDRRVVPFAVFSKGRWLTPAAEAMVVGELGVPVPQDSRAWFLSDRPWPGEWVLASPPGGAVVKTSDTLAAVSNHCQHNWAIPVSGEGRPLGRNEHHENAAFAISRRVEMEVTPAIASDGPDAKRILQFLLPTLDADEAATPHPGQPVRTPAERARAVLRVTKLHRILSRTPTIWHIEMERAYPGKPGENCESISWLQAWVAENGAGQLTTLSRKFSATDCDRKGDVLIRPLATVVVAGRRFLFTVEHGYEDETYRIYEMTDNPLTLVASVTGGGC